MSIYEEIGGLPAVAAAVDIFYEKLLADPIVAHYFDGHPVGKLKGHQRGFLITALGGPEIYRGKDMKAAHVGLGITSVAFDQVVTHLIATLEELRVAPQTIGGIVELLGPLKDEIVQDATADRS